MPVHFSTSFSMAYGNYITRETFAERRSAVGVAALSACRRWHPLVRLNIVIHSEKICRIVLVLQGKQAIIVGSVCRARGRITFVGDVVPIRVSGQKWPHGIPTLPCPRDVDFGIRWALPIRPDKEVPRVLAMRECCIRDSDASGSSMPMFNERSE